MASSRSRSPQPRSSGAAAAPGGAERLTAALIARMQSGTSPWRRDWDSEAGHHVNLLSGRRYRGANPILLGLALACRDSTRPYWCGFAEARARGLAPRRGVQAVHVLRPQLLRRPGASEGGSDSRSGQEGEGGPRPRGEGETAQTPGATWIRYRPVAVFHVDDLEGDALADLIAARRNAAQQERRPQPERLAAAEAVLSRWPVPVRHGGDRACYLPAGDRIQLPERDAFHSSAALYATWAHEAIHSTGHASRLARDLSGSLQGDAAAIRAYAREELVAELGAVLLGDRLEIGSDVANHAAYLNHWIELLQDSPQLLLRLLSEARQAVDLICPEAPDEVRSAD